MRPGSSSRKSRRLPCQSPSARSVVAASSGVKGRAALQARDDAVPAEYGHEPRQPRGRQAVSLGDGRREAQCREIDEAAPVRRPERFPVALEARRLLEPPLEVPLHREPCAPRASPLRRLLAGQPPPGPAVGREPADRVRAARRPRRCLEPRARVELRDRTGGSRRAPPVPSAASLAHGGGHELGGALRDHHGRPVRVSGREARNDRRVHDAKPVDPADA